MEKRLITEIERVKELMGLSLLTESDFVYPVNGKKVGINSGYGMRKHPRTGKMTMHRGLDLYAISGTDILSPADGTVTKIVYKVYDPKTLVGACGGEMIIDHGEIDGKKIRTRYCHIRDNKVEVGDKVEQGQIVAISGGAKGEKGAGNSSGAHLHWEVYVDGKIVNPKPYYDKCETTTGKASPTKDNDTFKIPEDDKPPKPPEDDKTTTTDDDKTTTTDDDKTTTTSGDTKGKHTWLDVKREFEELKARLKNIKYLNIDLDKIKEKLKNKFPNMDFEKIKEKIKMKFPDIDIDILDKIEKPDIDLSKEKEKVKDVVDKLKDFVDGEDEGEKPPSIEKPSDTDKTKKSGEESELPPKF